MIRAITWIVMPLMLVSTAGAANLAEVLVDRVINMHALDTTHYQVEMVSSRMKTRLVNPDDVTVESMTTRPPIGLTSYLVHIREGDRLIERGQVRVKIHKFDSVLVARQDVKRRDPITEESFELSWHEVTTVREQPLYGLPEAAGSRLKRNLRKGTLLTTSLLERVPDLEVGGEVTIVFNDGVCTITAPGKTLQSGSAGDRVQVKNTVSGKVIQATVVDGRSVSVGDR